LGTLAAPIIVVGALSLGVLFDGISLFKETERPKINAADLELWESPRYFWQRLAVESSVYGPRSLSEVRGEPSYWDNLSDRSEGVGF
jgi:hypothetical protein